MSKQIRIKLEKFVSGPEQRIFKTKTKFLEDNLNYLNTYLNFYLETDPYKDSAHQLSAIIGRTDIYLGEYNTNKLYNAKANNIKILTGDLINFHDVSIQYLTHNPKKENKITYNRYGKSMVSTASIASRK